MSRRKQQSQRMLALGCAAGLAAVTSVVSAVPIGPIDGEEGVGDFVFNDIVMAMV